MYTCVIVLTQVCLHSRAVDGMNKNMCIHIPMLKKDNL